MTLWWGRFWVVLTYLALAATYVCAIKYMPPQKVNIPRLAAACGVAMLWQTALVIAIWMRNSWARSLYIGLLLIAVTAFAAVVPILYMQRPRNPKPYIQKVEGCVAVHVAALIMLTACKPIKKLTSRSYQ